MTAPKSFAKPGCNTGIHTIHDLRCHLQVALELEHSTIPPYLCALYSIPDGSNVVAASVIRSVAMEEMLHMVLVANLLNSIGGTPLVDDPSFIPEYPTFLPHSDEKFKVHLLPFSPRALETFRLIERPTPADGKPIADGYHTIGEFYLAIWQGFERLAAEPGGEVALFCGDPSRQVDEHSWYYGGGGEPIVVTNLASAKRAIDEITEQGEGYDGTIYDNDTQFGQLDEPAHYFRFTEIAAERRFDATDSVHGAPSGDILPVDWSARYPMMDDPKMAKFTGQPDVHAMMLAFNRQYTALLRALHDAFNGAPASLKGAVPIMYDLKYRAQALMAVPSGRGDGTTVGPSFEYVP